jgi:3-keto-disaccharide hydrolase
MKSTLFFAAALLVCGGFSVVVRAEDQGKALFNGKTLEGWSGNEKFWSVKDGAITGQTTAENPTKGNTFLIWKGGDVKDFELELKFKIIGGNSGIQYRSSDLGDFVVGGYQGDIEAGDKYIGILYEEKGRGILAERGEKVVIGADGKREVVGKTGDSKEIADAVKKEDWNEYEVIAKGNHLIQKINGRTTIDVTDNESSKAKASGILALQLHAGPPMMVQFKDIQFKELK